MKKLLSFFVALIATSALWASNVITYTASAQLTEVSSWSSDGGLHTNAFNVSIASHTFSNGTGTITFSGEVTSIGDAAFQNCSGLTSITIPNSVTSIGWWAFEYCRSLTSITIPNSVTSIGNDAFNECSGLTSITIPNSVTSIGDYAFSGCSSLTSVTIPNSVTSIGYGAFSGCFGLTSVTIGNSVTYIGMSAFSGCSGLTSITIGNSVTYIGMSAFSGCSGLTSIVVESGNSKYDSRGNCNAIIGTANNELIAGCQNTIIPSSVTSIGNDAFSGCSGLTSITIPNSVTSIGYGAFGYCSGLTSVTIPESVTSIENSAFQNCSGLTSITIPNSLTSIGDRAFYRCSNLTSVTIPNSVTSIGNYAFDNVNNVVYSGTATGSPWGAKCVNGYVEGYLVYNDAAKTKLCGCSSAATGEITIPSSVTSIGSYAFYDCFDLTSVTIPNSVTSIGSYAFYGCFDLTSVTIPNSVTSIGDYAFSFCSRLTSITIPSSVTSIGDQTFFDCSGLTSITCEAMTPPACGSLCFFGISSAIPVYVPCDVIATYQNADEWKNFTNIQCIAAEQGSSTTKVTVTPSDNTVDIVWPKDDAANTYTIVITKNGTTICTLTFNSNGQLMNIAFAPGRDGESPARVAELINGSWSFTVTSLTPATKYDYSVTTKNAAQSVLNTYTGSFTTTGTTPIDNISTEVQAEKLLRDGQIFIQRGRNTYDLRGQVVK